MFEKYWTLIAAVIFLAIGLPVAAGVLLGYFLSDSGIRAKVTDWIIARLPREK